MGKLDDVLGSADEFGELLENAPEMADLLKNTDETIDLLGSTDEFTSGAGENYKAGSFDDLPSAAQNSYKGYEGNGWKGNYSGQTPGTNAGRAWGNELGDLKAIDRSGNQITYREFDVNNRISGTSRDSERFIVGSDGSIYYTPNHYGTFIRIK